MRKLLSTFSALLLGASVSSSVVACGNASPQSYSFLIDGAKLYQGMNKDYTTSYIESVVAQNVVNKVFKNNNPYQGKTLRDLAEELYDSGIINVTSNKDSLSTSSTPSIGITFERGTDYNPTYQDWVRQYATITGKSGSSSLIANHDIQLGQTYYVTPQVLPLSPAAEGGTTPKSLGTLNLGAVNLTDLQKLANKNFPGKVTGTTQAVKPKTLSDEIIDYMYQKLNIDGSPVFKNYNFTKQGGLSANPNAIANSTNRSLTSGLLMYGQYTTTTAATPKWSNIYSKYNDPDNYNLKNNIHTNAFSLPFTIPTGYDLESAWKTLDDLYTPFKKKGKEVSGRNATSYTVHLFLDPNQIPTVSPFWSDVDQYRTKTNVFDNYLDIALQINNGKQTYTQDKKQMTANPGDLYWTPTPTTTKPTS